MGEYRYEPDLDGEALVLAALLHSLEDSNGSELLSKGLDAVGSLLEKELVLLKLDPENGMSKESWPKLAE